MFPWWLGNDLHLLFINIVSFQGYGLSENTISGTLVAAFSLRSPPGFSPMVLSTIEGSHGWDNDSRWSFHEHTHHVDRLHGGINILPWTERFDRAKFISAEFYWQSSFFFYSDITDSVAVPPAPSQRLWTAGKGGRRRSDGVLQVLAFWGWASGAAQRCWIRFGSGKFFPCRAATTAVSTSLVIVCDVLADWRARNKTEYLGFTMMKTIFQGCGICFGKM